MITEENLASPFETFSQIAIVGAAGKMGSGIALLILQEMARCRFTSEKPRLPYRLKLIDLNVEQLDGLKQHLKEQILRWAEKNIVFLRKAVSDNPHLVSNREIIEYFLTEVMDIAHFGSSLDEAKTAQLIFEAIAEDIDKKKDLLKVLHEKCIGSPYFFTNTSSIPISVLNQNSLLEERIIGFHFYNPPAMQKLIELIPLKESDPALTRLAVAIATKLNKQIVISQDIAGFIGNGHFLREIAYACKLMLQLGSQHGWMSSLYIVNRLTQDFLLRPMGIFQLIDYVGLDIIDNIGKIMNHYLHATIYEDTLLKMLFQIGSLGGQKTDGSQKEGFFKYIDHKIIGIYSPEEKKYANYDSFEGRAAAETWLGVVPERYSWQCLHKSQEAYSKAKDFFTKLAAEKTKGAELAIDYLLHSQTIAEKLVKDGVAASIEDVDTVLKQGFYHLYGPSEITLKEAQKP